MKRNTYKTKKPTAHLAYLVLTDIRSQRFAKPKELNFATPQQR